MIESLHSLSHLVQQGCTDWKQFGEVNATYHEGLVLFNYTALAQFQNRWNWFETHSRGLILDAESGEVVALPFPKFFNWGERGRTSSGPIVEATEKMDGSLGILYRHQGKLKIATRGSFTSEQALWATERLQYMDLAGLPHSFTMLFEIIYPENRIVVDYKGRQGLFLLGIRNRFTGEDYPLRVVHDFAAAYGIQVPLWYDFTSVEDVLRAAAKLTANEEGWVLRFADGQRFKIKGEAYRLAHRIMTQVTFSRVLQSVQAGQFDAMIEGVPDEFLSQIRQWKAYIDTTVRNVQLECQTRLRFAPSGSQKEFALWVQQENAKRLHAYVYALKAGKDITPLIYKHAFNDIQDAPILRVILMAHIISGNENVWYINTANANYGPYLSFEAAKAVFDTLPETLWPSLMLATKEVGTGVAFMTKRPDW